MWSLMKSFLESLSRIPEGAVLGLNAALAAFVTLAHGGALLLVMSGKVPTPPGYAEMVRRLAPITLPLAAASLVSGAVATIWRNARPAILRGQALVVFVSGLGLLWWSGGVLFHGIPAGNFSWTPGMLSGWVAYSFLVASRFLTPDSWGPRRIYAPLAGVVLAAPVDIGVFARLATHIARHF
jgi:hypothetical protein